MAAKILKFSEVSSGLARLESMHLCYYTFLTQPFSFFDIIEDARILIFFLQVCCSEIFPCIRQDFCDALKK